MSQDRISVSSWSLHRELGAIWNYLPDGAAQPARETPFGEGNISLLQLPEMLKAHGIFQLEICSFHLPSLSKSYFAELKAALASSGVALQTLLIEAGDPSVAETGARDIAFMAEWVKIADQLGAKYARVIAGKAEPEAHNLQLAAQNLSHLCDLTATLEVRIVTENWFSLLSSAAETNWLLDAVGPRLGLNGDLGNWAAPEKYENLSNIMGRAELCHAKAHFENGQLDAADFGRCVRLSESAGYKGPYTLIFDNDAPNEWDGIAIEKAFVTDILANG